MNKKRYPLYALLGFLVLLLMAVLFGGPTAPSPMTSVNDPFEEVRYEGLPDKRYTTARDGTDIAYRRYTPNAAQAKGLVVMVHGSSGSSRSLHSMAKALASAGYGIYALDMRGHGASGEKGHIDYVGQLEDDLQDFSDKVLPGECPRTLLGFSAGGGFALRVAASQRHTLFDHYLLLAPFLHQQAPTYQPSSGGWVDVGIPRMVALMLLNRVGITTFNHLPVLAFAVPDETPDHLTPSYSYHLAMNFRPDNDYRAAIARIQQPTQVLVGGNDEVFRAGAFKRVFEQANPAIGVRLVPQLSHIGLTLKKRGIHAVLSALRRFESQQPSERPSCTLHGQTR